MHWKGSCALQEFTSEDFDTSTQVLSTNLTHSGKREEMNVPSRRKKRVFSVIVPDVFAVMSRNFPHLRAHVRGNKIRDSGRHEMD